MVLTHISIVAASIEIGFTNVPPAQKWFCRGITPKEMFEAIDAARHLTLKYFQTSLLEDLWDTHHCQLQANRSISEDKHAQE